MYGMVKTTVYLPESLKAALEKAAAIEGCSEAKLIREALESHVSQHSGRRPRVPLVDQPLGDPTLAERVEALLGGFGEP
jgi:Ribbon-helix-helix protein, copG family